MSSPFKPSILKLHLFDFDGTLTKADSMFAFIKFTHGFLRYWMGLLLLLPTWAGMAIGLVPAAEGKRKLLSYFYKNWAEENLRAQGQLFCAQRLPMLLRPAGLKALQQCLAAGDEVVIVSASLDIWLKPISKHLGTQLICTQLAFEDHYFRGNLASPNCNGPEKVLRIKAHYRLDQYEKVLAYGDTEGDRAMFELADEYFFKPFRK